MSRGWGLVRKIPLPIPDITHVFACRVYLYNAIWARNSIFRTKSAILPKGYIRLYCIKRLFEYWAWCTFLKPWQGIRYYYPEIRGWCQPPILPPRTLCVGGGIRWGANFSTKIKGFEIFRTGSGGGIFESLIPLRTCSLLLATGSRSTAV